MFTRATLSAKNSPSPKKFLKSQLCLVAARDHSPADGNGNRKFLCGKIPFVWTRKERRPTEEQEYNVDWRLVRIFRQFLHQFFSSHFCGHATKSHFSVTIRQQHIIQFHITHSWNSIFSQYQGSSRYLHFCFGFLSFDSNSNKNRRNNTKKGGCKTRTLQKLRLLPKNWL